MTESEFVRRTFLKFMAAGAAGAALAPALGGTGTALAGTARPAAPNVGGYLSATPAPGGFPLVAGGRAAPLVVSGSDYAGVTRVVGDLRADIESVTGVTPKVITADDATTAKAGAVVIVGTVGKSPLIDQLTKAGKLDVSDLAGKWETSVQQVVDHPLPGVAQALVIAGSDQRGTIFGAYDVSKNAGVSPWYWWCDVPAARSRELYVRPGRHSQGTPAVKYRGFFINDENPNLGTWGPEYFGPGLAKGYPGGFNRKFHAKVFELALRLKANYFWPAEWGRAFALDDPQNHATATAYGIVMGTSHDGPMLRGIEEWNRFAVPAVRDANGNITTPGSDPYGGTGEWSFRYNAPAIEKYFTAGIQRMVDQNIEGVVTVGMRGNGDTALSDGDGIDLMNQIITAERNILTQVTGKTDLSSIPQVWTMYKEVQDYWEQGLKPPEDVTVVFTDDNWGNMRHVPDAGLAPRPGGYGMYYHFDYVGGGRDYKWTDTANIANTWEQLHLAYSYGIRQLWIANSGDVKGNELPTQFFLDYAWDPGRWTADNLHEWERSYAAQSFGPENAEDIAALLHDYGRLTSRRKPELLDRLITVDPSKDLSTDSSAVVYTEGATPFSLTDYRELDRVTAEWRELSARATAVAARLPKQYSDAWYEIVGYELQATANLYALRRAEFTNIFYAGQGRASANALAQEAETRFAHDQAMMKTFNTTVAGGKWKDFMLQPHIDYGDVAKNGPDNTWQEPEDANGNAIPDVLFPAVKRVTLASSPQMGVGVDGSADWWPNSSATATLPALSPHQSQAPAYIDVFNRGQGSFGYTITPGASYVKATPARGRVTDEVRAVLSVDWARAPQGTTTVPVTVAGSDGTKVTVHAVVDNPAVSGYRLTGFIESNGYVSMEAAHYSRAVGGSGVSWQRIPDIGRTGDGMTPAPVTASAVTPGSDTPRLEYTMTLFSTGPVTVWAYLSPRCDIFPASTTSGLRYAVSIDDASPQTVNIQQQTGSSDAAMNKQWERVTSENTSLTSTSHTVSGAGAHTLKFWMVDPTVIVQKLVVDTGGVKRSYFGPPESRTA